ncbi:hypothetical protein [Castellaniella sp.]|nr:hypothetical protein [Castellaniella sp.]
MKTLHIHTAGNAAGMLQYCIQNKYLGGTNATSVKAQLLGNTSSLF